MGSFGAVIPVVGLNVGYLGQVSRTGGGDPFIVAKLANSANAANITFGDTTVVLPDATGGTYKQFADFLANGGGTAISTATASSTTLTPASAALAGIRTGMFVFGTGITPGTYVTAVNYGAGTLTISQAATASATVNLYYASFGGIAVREVKTQLSYPYTPGGAEIGNYLPGQYTEALVRGSVCTKIYNGTPYSNGPVYVRAVLNGGTYPNGIVGGLEAIADGTNNILLNGVTFKTGVQDANGICEVTFLERMSA